MTVLRTLTLAVLCFALAAGCTRKAKPAPIDELKLVTDELRSFSMSVPSNWFKQQRTGDLILASTSKTIGQRFMNFGAGDGGAKVEIRALVLDSVTTMDTVISRFKLEFEDDLDRYTAETAQLGGKPAKKLTVKFDQIDGEFQSVAYFAEQDSIVTMVQFAAFGNTFGDYQERFNEILATVKLAKRPAPIEQPKVAAPTGPEPPSDTLRVYNAPDFSIQIPQNFEGKKGTVSALSSMNFLGSRYDCTIQVDVFDAKDQKNLNKIVEQNKGRYGGGSAAATTIDGEKAYYFSYNPAANVSSRAYFTVKNGKMFRVTLNWFKPEQSVYLPLFERCLATMDIK